MNNFSPRIKIVLTLDGSFLGHISVTVAPTSNKEQSLLMVAYELNRAVQFSIRTKRMSSGDYHKSSLL